MKRIRVFVVWMIFVEIVASRHLLGQVDISLKQTRDDVEQESNLELQLDHLFRQISPPEGPKVKSSGVPGDDFVDDSYEDETILERTKDAFRPLPFQQVSEDDPSSPEVVYGKVVFYPSAVPVDPTHRSSTEVESAILNQFRPPVVVNEQHKDTTTASPKKGGKSSKKRRKNERKAAREERMLENLIQLAEIYGTETRLGDMLKKLCVNSTISCRGFDSPKEVEEQKKNRRKQNVASRQQNPRGKGRRSKNSKNKSQNLTSLTTEETERKWNKQNRKSKANRRNKNSRVTNVMPTSQSAVTSISRDLSPGINKTESKKRRRLSGSGVLPTIQPSDNLEDELIDLENGNRKAEDRLSRRMKKHRSMKNDTRDRLQKHVRQQIALHRRVQQDKFK